MAKTLTETPVTTAKARSGLPSGVHWRRLDAEAHLGYRKSKRSGVWLVRWRNRGEGAAYRQAPIGTANDRNDKPADGTLTFQQAEGRARERVGKARADAKVTAAGLAVTVRSAVEDYIDRRDRRDTKRAGRPIRSDAAQRLTRYVLGRSERGRQDAIKAAKLADVALHALTESDLRKWRDSLPGTMKAASIRRLVSDLRAALNAAYVANRKKLDTSIRDIIKFGLVAGAGPDDDDAEPAARDNQILSDAQVSRLILAARDIDAEQDWEGDLCRLVVVLAATGARFSQVVRLKVADVQRAQSRLMVPVSRKGRGKSGATPIPVGKDVMDALLPATTGRANDAVLLERWKHRPVPGLRRWERAGRGPWQSPSELTRPWQDVRKRVEMPEVIPYGLRHSSIVRGIRSNLPIRLVAALHDTSVVMVEKHYSRWITSGLEELAARAVVPLVPQEEGGKVVPMVRA